MADSTVQGSAALDAQDINDMTVIDTPTGHEHHVRSGTCGRGEHPRCRRRSQYDARCVYVCTCVCHRGGKP